MEVSRRWKDNSGGLRMRYCSEERRLDISDDFNPALACSLSGNRGGETWGTGCIIAKLETAIAFMKKVQGAK